jgi:rod shape-determining protein MreC
MESIFVRYRNLLVLLALLVAQILGLAMQVRRTRASQGGPDPGDGRSVSLLRLWANAVVTPPERAIHSSTSGVSYLWNNYFDLRHVREQNQDLQKTMDRLRLEQAALLEDARQGQRLQAMLNFQQKYIYKTLAAQIIGSSGTDQSRVFYLDKGKNEGLDRDMAVITADGIVGKVRDVFPHSAQVLAINDQSSGAGVILESTRIRGILRGNAAGQPQIVDVIADNRIQPGEKVLTAGGDQIFPRGLPVGVVEKVVRDPERDAFINVILKPAAHLDRLDEVLVITSTEPRFPQDQQKDMATSEALKGAEVEAAEQQKRTSAGMSEKLPGLIDPNLPTDQQPLNDDSNPNPVAHPPQALHPDRFTPGAAGMPPSTGGPVPGAAAEGAQAPNAAIKKKPAAPQNGSGSAPAKGPATAPAKPQANTPRADASPRRKP